MNGVIGYYSTQFGELWERSLTNLIEEAINGVLKNCGMEIDEIDAIFFANMLAGVLENNLHTTAKIAEIIKTHIPIYRIESACASGGTAFNLACSYLQGYQNKTVMVIGAEKMTDYSPEEVISALAGAASGEEQEAGLTFAGVYGMLAQYYLNRYHYTEENLAYVSYKNHFHGSLNSKAHFRKKISLKDVLTSPYVAYPLKVMDASPISDGAAALIITNNSQILKKTTCVKVLTSVMATDTIALKCRQYLDRIPATQLAAQQAYRQARIGPEMINIAELHDCFSIAEIIAMEDLGFWPRGQAGKLITQLSTMIGSGEKLIINTSGGLKAAGHPIGATGVKQIGEIYLQLTHQARGRQLKGLKYGLAHNVGGSGGTAVVTILEA